MIRLKLNLSDRLISLLLALLIFFASITIVLTVNSDTSALEDENSTPSYSLEIHYKDSKGESHLAGEGAVVTYRITRYPKDGNVLAANRTAKTDENGKVQLGIRTDIEEEPDTVYIMVKSVSYYGYTFNRSDEYFELNKGIPLAIQLTSQSQVNLLGVITGADGKPVSGAKIKVSHSTAPAGSKTVAASDDGTFKTPVYINQNYDLTIAANGYQTKTVSGIFASKDESADKIYQLSEPIRLEEKLTDENIGFQISEETVEYIDKDNHSFFNNELLKSADNDGKVTYTVTLNGAKTSAVYEDNTLDFSDFGPGKYIVTANIKGASKYFDAKTSFTLNVVDTNFKFNSEVVTAEMTDGEIEIQEIFGNYDKNLITYTLSDKKGTIAELNQDTKIISFKKYGSVTVTAYYNEEKFKENSKLYQSIAASYELQIVHQPTKIAFKKSNVQVRYGADDNQYTQSVKTNDDNLTAKEKKEILSKIRYSVSEQTDSSGNPVTDRNIVEVDRETGLVKINEAGKVTISAAIEDSDNFSADTVDYELNILKANQDTDQHENIYFENTKEKAQDTVTFSSETSTLTYTNHLIDNSGIDGTVTYEITAGSDLASINSKTGTLTINKAGTITVRAIKTAKESNNYTNSIRTYRLIVEKGIPDFQYELSEENIYYGKNVIATQKPTLSTKMKKDEKPEITYTVANLSNSPVHHINSSNGNVQLNNKEPIGSFEVTATLAETDKYASISISYIINISYAKEEEYTVTETQYDQWYNTANGVTFTANDGYSISANNSFAENNWKKTEYKYTTANKNQDVVFYLRNNETKAISEITASNINIDYTVPTELEINYSETSKSFLQEIGDRIFFGLFGSSENEIKVTVKAHDNIAEIIEFRYYYQADESANGIYGSTSGGDTITEKDIKNIGDGYYEAEFTIPAEFKGKIGFTAKNAAGLESEKEFDKTIIVDKTAPKTEITFNAEPSNENKSNGVKYFNNDSVEVQFKVTEPNFSHSEEETAVIINDKLQKDIQWTRQPDSNDYIAKKELVAGQEYRIQLSSQDIGGQQSDESTVNETIVIDNIAPSDQNMSIRYSKATTFWENILGTVFYWGYQGSVTVTFEAADDLSGIDHIDWTYTRQDNSKDEDAYISDRNAENMSGTVKISEDGKTASITLKDDYYRGSFSFTATDIAGNKSNPKKDDGTVIVVDQIAPESTVTFENVEQTADDILYYKKDAEITVNVEEVNFYPDDITLKLHHLENSDEDTVISDLKWNQETDSNDHFVTSFKVEKDGKYQIIMTAKDHIDNVNDHITVETKDTVGKKTDTITAEAETDPESGETYYTSPIFVIDTKAPVVTVKHSTNNIKNKYDDIEYFATKKEFTIEIDEHNFRPDLVTIKVNATDVSRKTVKLSDDFTSALKNDKLWEHNGDIHTATITFSDDAKYQFTVDCNDLSKNEAHTCQSNAFVIDKTAPSTKGMTVSYSKELNFWEKIVDGITFGYYAYQKSVTVTLTANDSTSGIDYIKWTYTKESGASSQNLKSQSNTIKVTNSNLSSDGKTATVKFTLNDNQYRGNISFTAIDKSGNSSEVKSDDHHIIIVDSVAPILDYVELSAANRVVNASTLKDVTGYDYKTRKLGYKLYYSGTATAKISITEANFYSEDVKVELERTYNQKTSKINASVKWTNNGKDNYIGTFSISDEGEYIANISYTDRSTNEMVSYTSNEIIIDKTNPKINVSYSPNNVIRTVKERKYYNKEQTATVTVSEHNFRADDIEVKVTGVDVANKSVIDETYYTSYFKNRSKWTKNGDTYTATITYSTDANYTFDISYKDLANRSAGTYQQDKFTVDTTPPEKLEISYSPSVLDRIIETITFKFYQAPVTVTVSAYDSTTPVNEFDTSGLNLNDTIRQSLSGAKISRSGYKNTATFQIPQSALTEATQFNGTIRFTAYDTSNNKTERSDNKRIVVDNISPRAEISYNAPVNTVGSVWYYSGNVNASVSITEANFYSEDVRIELERTHNGNTAVVIPSVNWKNDGNDRHTGTFSILDEGEYIVRINYTDRSSNSMAGYTSNEIVVDHTDPVINVAYSPNNPSNTVNGYKYYNEVQTATITITEHNFRANEVIAEVKGVDVTGKSVVDGNNYQSHLNNSNSWTKNGDTYTAKITYSADANYTFSISYKDLANRSAAPYSNDKFTVDKTPPKDLKIKYSQSVIDKVIGTITFGFYKAPVAVTISASDDTTPISKFDTSGLSKIDSKAITKALSGNNIQRNSYENTATFQIPQEALTAATQFNGTISFTAYDTSNNKTDLNDTKRVVVDNIAPTVEVSYNEPVKTVNGTAYYSGTVNAAVSIAEANFYSEDVKVVLTRKNDSSTNPSVNWTDGVGNQHTGTFSIADEGEYIINVSYTDRSGNEMTNYESNTIIVDKTSPTLTVSNIKHHSATSSETFGFTVKSTDEHFDKNSFKATLTALVRNNSGEMQTKNIDLSKYLKKESDTSYSYVIDNLTDNAVYTLSCSSKDLAGNSIDKMKLSDNKTYDKTEFSINRNGSTFSVNNNTEKLIDNRIVYSVNEDIVIQEVNVTPIESYSIKLNDKELKEGQDFTAEIKNSDTEWCSITYTIDKSLFENEADYSIKIDTTDKAGSTSYNDKKSSTINFTVDKSKPTITVSGIEDGGRYQVGEQKVTAIVKDNSGIKSLKITVLDSSGNPILDSSGKNISVRFDHSGDALNDYLDSNGRDIKVAFTVPEGLDSQVVIECCDNAVGTDGKPNQTIKTITGITVSQNNWIIFYANKPLFYGCLIGGLAILIALAFTIAIIVRKKRAKSES